MYITLWIIRILALILCALNLPLVLLGWGILTIGGFLGFSFLSLDAQFAIRQNYAISSGGYKRYIVSIVLGLFSSILSVYLLYGLSSLDTGNSDERIILVNAPIIFIVTSILVYILTKLKVTK